MALRAKRPPKKFKPTQLPVHPHIIVTAQQAGRALRGCIRSAGRIMGYRLSPTALPHLTPDPSHPLFGPLPSGTKQRSMKILSSSSRAASRLKHLSCSVLKLETTAHAHYLHCEIIMGCTTLTSPLSVYIHSTELDRAPVTRLSLAPGGRAHF